MGTLTAFLFISVDGFYKDSRNSIDWHTHSTDGTRLSEKNLSQQHTLLFGRITYELMASFWPTAAAQQLYPTVADGMKNANKLVVSNSLKEAKWQNTKIIHENWIDEIRTLKQTINITVLGSGSIVTELVNARLLDEITLLTDPIALGSGTTIFHGIIEPIKLTCKESRQFDNGEILSTYSIRQ